MSPQSRRLAHPALCPLSRRPRLRYCGIISWRAKNLNARRLGQGRQALNLSRSNCHSIPPSAADLGKKSHSVIVAARNWGPRPELRRRSRSHFAPTGTAALAPSFSSSWHFQNSSVTFARSPFAMGPIFFPFGPKSLGSTDHDRPIGDVYRITDRHRIG